MFGPKLLNDAAVVIIATHDLGRFYTEIKGPTYHIPAYRGHKSFFGGEEKPKDGGDPKATLTREVCEELQPPAAGLVLEAAVPYDTFTLASTHPWLVLLTYKLAVFEARLSNADFEKVASLPPLEERCTAAVLTLEEFKTVPLVHRLGDVRKDYLEKRIT